MKFFQESTKIIFFKASVLSFFFFTDVYAYLDPGTGSFILQAVIAFIAAALTFVSGLWLKIKQFFIKMYKVLRYKNKDKETD